jgi:MYXO-CTERM domain-containing protein
MSSSCARRLAPLAVAVAAACGCAEPGPESAPAVDGPVAASAASITAADAISRAEEWVTAQLQYCQSPNGADDSIDPSCSPVCHRTSNPDWDPYRSDCSGLVSWAWDLPAPGRTTAEFAPNETDITSEIQASSLQTGDAVCTDDSTSSDHHIMLFKAWTIQGQEATFIEEPGCSSNPDYAHEFTSSVTLSGTSITVAYNGVTFHAIRYAELQQGPVYAASYVSQSWPLSSDAPVQMTQGQMMTGSIDLKNTGNITWQAGNVKLAPIPRDQASGMQAPTWLSPTRVSTIASDVAPGDVGHFEWDLDPSQPGSFMPYFGLVAEGTTWFADSGGPPDDDMQVNLVVAPGPASATSTTGTGAGASSGASTGSHGTGTGQPTTTTGTGDEGSGAGAPSGHGVDDRESNDAGGCSSTSRAPSPAPVIALAALGALVALRRRRAR